MPSPAFASVVGTPELGWAVLDELEIGEKLFEEVEEQYSAEFAALLARFLTNNEPITRRWWEQKQREGAAFAADESLQGRSTIFSRLAGDREEAYLVSAFSSLVSSVEVGLDQFKGSQGAAQLASLLQRRYGTTATRKRQLAQVLSLITDPNVQPIDTIRALLGEADNGKVESLTLLNATRSGATNGLALGGKREAEYLLYTADPQLVISPPPARGGRPARAKPLLRATGRWRVAQLLDGGSGYAKGEEPEVRVLTSPGFGSSRAVVRATTRNGQVEALVLEDAGSGYVSADGKTPLLPRVVIAAPRTQSPGNRPARATLLPEYTLLGLELLDGGSGYILSEPPSVVLRERVNATIAVNAADAPAPSAEGTPSVGAPGGVGGAAVGTAAAAAAGAAAVGSAAAGTAAAAAGAAATAAAGTAATAAATAATATAATVATSTAAASTAAATGAAAEAAAGNSGVVEGVALAEQAPPLRFVPTLEARVATAEMRPIAAPAPAPAQGELSLRELESNLRVAAMRKGLDLPPQRTRGVVGAAPNLPTLPDYVVPIRDTRTGAYVLPVSVPPGAFGQRAGEPVEAQPSLQPSQAARIFASGALCSSLAHTLLVPIDVVKTTLQQEEGTYSGPLGCARGVVQRDGPAGLLRGAGATAAGYAVAGALSFGFVEFFGRELRGAAGPGNALLYGAPLVALASMGATALCSLAVCPFEAVRVSSVRSGKPGLTVLSEVLEAEGVGGLYAGLPAILLKEVPFVVTKFVVFDVISDALAHAVDSAGLDASPLLATALTLVAGAGAGVAAVLASQPADAAFTLTNEGPQVTVESAVATLRANPRLILSGLGARLLFGVLLVSLQFFLFQSLKSELGVSKADLTLVYDALAPLRGEGLGSL